MPIVHGTWTGFCSTQFAGVVGLPPQIGAIQASPSGPAQIHGFAVDAFYMDNGSPLFVALIGAPSNLAFTVHFVDDNGDHIDLASGDAQVESYGPGGISTTGFGNVWQWGGLVSFGTNLTNGRQYTITWT